MARVRVDIKSNAAQVAKNIEKRIRKLRKDSKATVRDVTEYGKHYAQSIAPIKTGDTIRAIKWVQGKKDASATIVFGNGHPETRGRLGMSFTKYMNTTKRGSPQYRHFTSGKPHFIRITADKVRGKFSRGMRRVVSRF